MISVRMTSTFGGTAKNTTRGSIQAYGKLLASRCSVAYFSQLMSGLLHGIGRPDV